MRPSPLQPSTIRLQNFDSFIESFAWINVCCCVIKLHNLPIILTMQQVGHDGTRQFSTTTFYQHQRPFLFCWKMVNRTGYGKSLTWTGKYGTFYNWIFMVSWIFKSRTFFKPWLSTFELFRHFWRFIIFWKELFKFLQRMLNFSIEILKIF